ncbi:MAG: hypothetical protein QOH79_1181, partial [Acidimicrobiaceae bacterium]
MTVLEALDALLAEEDASAGVLVAVLTAIVVLGADATRAAVYAVSGRSRDAVDGAVAQFAAARVITMAPVLALTDADVATRALEHAPPRQLAELHARAAEHLHDQDALPSSVAQHLLEAPPMKAPWAIDALRHAAVERRRAGDQRAAAVLLERALEERPALEIHKELLLELAAVNARVETEAAIGRYEEVLTLIDDRAEESATRLRLAVCLGYANRVHEALAEVDRAAAIAPSEAERLRAGMMFVGLARQNLDTRPLGPERLKSLAATLEGRADASGRALLAELAYEQCLAGEPREQVRNNALEALGGPSMSGVHDLPPLGRHVALLSLIWCGELGHAERAIKLVLTRAVRRGDTVTQAAAYQLMTTVHWYRSELRDLVDAASRSLQQQDTPTLPAAHGFKALAHACLGERDEATAALQLPGGEDGWTAIASFHGYLAASAYTALVLGDHERAYRDAMRCGTFAKAMGTLNPAVLAWQAIAAEAAAELGLFEVGASLADDAVIAARRFGEPLALSTALHAAATVQRDPAVVLPLLEEAVRLAEQTPQRLHLSRCLRDIGRALVRLGRRTEAAETFSRAMAIAEEIGAVQVAATIASDRASLCDGDVDVDVESRSVLSDLVRRTHVQVLGGFRVLDAEGRDVTPSGVPGKAVRILVAARRPLHPEELADRLWEGLFDPAQVRARLRNVLSRARTPDGPLIARCGDLLEISPEIVTDVSRFEQAAGAAVAANKASGAFESALAAITLYSGDLLPTDPFADWS